MVAGMQRVCFKVLLIITIITIIIIMSSSLSASQPQESLYTEGKKEPVALLHFCVSAKLRDDANGAGPQTTL